MSQNANTRQERGKAGAVTRRRALGDITNAVEVPIFRTVIAEQTQEATVESKENNEDGRAYMQRSIDDIDERDVNNPLLATVVVNEMYDNFNEQEKEFQLNFNYMMQQVHITEKMRSVLVDWLVS